MNTFLLFYFLAICIYVVLAQSSVASATGDVTFRNRVVEVEPAIPIHRKLRQKIYDYIKDIRTKRSRKKFTNSISKVKNDKSSLRF